MIKYLHPIFAAALLQLGWSSWAAAAFIDLPPNGIFLRDASASSCAANYTSCGSSYSGSFCCSSDTTCLRLDSGSSVLCCPTGSDCTFIEPITCNVQAMNATANPTAPIQSTKLNEDLPTCAEGSTTSASGSPTTVASGATTRPTATATSTISISDTAPTAHTTSTASAATATPTTAFSNSTQTETTAKCPQFPATAVIAGFFPGAVAGALAAAIMMMCRRRGDQKNRESTLQKTHRSSGGTIVGISDPILDDENGSFRTDFLLQRKLSGRYPTPGTVARSKSMMRRTGTRVKSIFVGTNHSSNSNAESPQWNTATPPMPPMPAMPAVRKPPVTPPHQTDRPGGGPRQPSTESIKVYSPPNMLGISSLNQDRNTTFSEVMEKAGFQNAKGEPSFRVTETPVQGNSPLRKN
ncbi:conserved hypothetical protein [Talaromyces stipitatus ATCC 10500]|uniref:GPI anchored protein n=1 Tax=Talaromyces stipitatus (strain ATCC 10500 / CBS 375.48 / QM 6759 / NRRL 1006) TaxID=441959 RepID=B8MGF7_TALSN|nr:uncharacterized protein TSTA_013770 [Talaromyces stipitatus ATCC 10500]EED16277.1 conserved hypothetical protein [Talaromyces stipitatus ATCC 10500]